MPFWGTQSGSHMQWCHAIQILVVHIGAVGQQVIHHLQIAEIHRILGPVVAIWKYTNEWKGNVDTPSGVCQSLCIYMISCYAAVSNSRPVTFQSNNVVHVHIFNENIKVQNIVDVAEAHSILSPRIQSSECSTTRNFQMRNHIIAQ